MIDLHAHLLPGVDDGPPDPASALALCEAMSAAGTRVVAATSHVNQRYGLDPLTIEERVGALRSELLAEAVRLEVVTGAEVEIARVPALSERELQACALAGRNVVLVESPYAQEAPFLEDALFELQTRGFRALLAHPERSPLFHAEPVRLEGLVRRGVRLSITASALTGRFGREVTRFALGLLARGWVHNIASDAHDLDARRPELAGHLEAAERDIPGLVAARGFFLEETPAALLAGSEPPGPPPALAARRRGRLRRKR